MQPEGSVWRIDICYPVTEKRRNPLLNDPMSEKFMNPEMDPAVTSCGNCHAPMPKELRFCRNCGFRLGEGSAEYTETVRFQNPGTHSGQGPSAFPQGFGGMTVAPGGKVRKRRRRMSGMTWIFLVLLLFFVASAGFTTLVKRVRPGMPGRPAIMMSCFDVARSDSIGRITMS